MLVPVKAYLTSGVGTHKEELVAFELALRDAGIAAQNLVTVSSIMPPACELIERSEGEKSLRPGQILHVVLSREETCEPHRALGASIGIARPVDRSLHGFIAEHGGFGVNQEAFSAHAEDLAVMMLASTLGIELDEAASAAERATELERSGLIADRGSITAMARGDADGRWTVVIAAAVFLMEWMVDPR